MVTPKECMGICSICKKISATDNDHLHCVEKRRVELENLQLKDTITEKLDLLQKNEVLMFVDYMQELKSKLLWQYRSLLQLFRLESFLKPVF